jgi:hypothetical protein
MMKKIILMLLCLITLTIAAPAQTSPKNEWMRVQSDNGEFSIEIPQKYDLLFDKDGFQIPGTWEESFELRNISMLNAYFNQTLLSFEIYEAKKVVLEAIYQREKNAIDWLSKQKFATFSEISVNAPQAKQLNIKKDDVYIFRRYFNSKKYIYILTAVSRSGETAAVKHFFDSIIFDPKSQKTDPLNGNVLSSLQKSPVEMISNNVAPFNSGENDTSAESDVKPMTIAWRPSESLVRGDRRANGTMKLRCTFNENGYISKIEFSSPFSPEISRQVLFATLRTKFLPKEKNGIPITSIKVFVQTFTSN